MVDNVKIVFVIIFVPKLFKNKKYMSNKSVHNNLPGG